MEAKTVVAVILVLLVIVGAVYYVGQLGSNSAPVVNQTTTLVTTVITTTAPPAQNLSNVTESKTPSSPDYTMTLTQLVNVLGSGWFVAENNTGNTTMTRNVAGQNFTVNSFAQANFSDKDGRYLIAEWDLLPSDAAASSFIGVQKSYNVTPINGTQGNATYWYASGFTLNGGQEAGYMYANDGPYAITMLSYGGDVFTQAQALQLLTYQLQNLNVT